MKKLQRPVQAFLAPVILSVITVLGLLAALIGGKPFHVLTWIALATPLLVIAFFLSRRRGRA